MGPTVHKFKLYPDERYIATMPWRVAQRKSAKPVQVTQLDGEADSNCICGSRAKLPNTDPANRSAMEPSERSKMLESSEAQARLRAAKNAPQHYHRSSCVTRIHQMVW